MQQLITIENPTFELPDCTPGALDYMAQAHTEEMYAFVHLFQQHTPLFGLQGGVLLEQMDKRVHLFCVRLCHVVKCSICSSSTPPCLAYLKRLRSIVST